MAPPAKRHKAKAVETLKAMEEIEPEHLTNTLADTNEDPQYPGFSSWNTTLEMSGGDNSTSKFDNDKAQFVQLARIYDPDAFTLKPLTITQGPLKGRCVIMVEPVNIVFRFMDLPAEIRLTIYEMLLKEDEVIAIDAFKKRHMQARAVRHTFRSSDHDSAWDEERGKWSNQPPSAHALLRVSRQIRDETAPIAYGDNTFSFSELKSLKAMNLFLGGIGDMRKFLRNLVLDGDEWPDGLFRTTFHKLKDAKRLHSLKLPHSVMCGGTRPFYPNMNITVDLKLVAHFKPLMKVLHKAQKSSDDPIKVLDIVKVLPRPQYLEEDFCQAGRDGKECTCERKCRSECCRYMFAASGLMCCELLQHFDEVMPEFHRELWQMIWESRKSYDGARSFSGKQFER